MPVVPRPIRAVNGLQLMEKMIIHIFPSINKRGVGGFPKVLYWISSSGDCILRRIKPTTVSMANREQGFDYVHSPSDFHPLSLHDCLTKINPDSIRRPVDGPSYAVVSTC